MRYLLLALLVSVAHAEPVAIASHDGVTVILTNEPCTIPVVRNLTLRATWTEKGSTFEGCYGTSQGLVVAYFDDRTVIVMPGQLFTKVRPL